MAEAEKKETWIQWVALTTTILAVCAAISSLKASSYSTRVQLSTTQEANKWAHYQAKAIREHTYKLNKDLVTIAKMEAKAPQVITFLDERLKKYDQEIGRYSKEKEEIMAEARDIQKQQDLLKHHNGAFALATMILQIAIMMNAVGALIKRKAMWHVGMALGLVGLVYMANGFFLFF
ncbi:MAG: DUF4337 domain-containing protein [Deltaproteobacteria bacterium]|nr:DUF4337 domain-containing protein [Deltaproteobacteria bacterium]